MTLYLKLWIQSVAAPRQIFGRGWGGGGRKEGVQGDALAFSRRRSCGPPVWCREENSDTDRECDSAPHPPGGAGGPQECHGKNLQTTPRMELYRDGATLYRCTQMETADLCPSSSLLTNQRQLTLLSFQFCVAVGFGEQDVFLIESCTVLLLSCVVR